MLNFMRPKLLLQPTFRVRELTMCYIMQVSVNYDVAGRVHPHSSLVTPPNLT